MIRRASRDKSYQSERADLFSSPSQHGPKLRPRKNTGAALLPSAVSSITKMQFRRYGIIMKMSNHLESLPFCRFIRKTRSDPIIRTPNVANKSRIPTNSFPTPLRDVYNIHKVAMIVKMIKVIKSEYLFRLFDIM